MMKVQILAEKLPKIWNPLKILSASRLAQNIFSPVKIRTYRIFDIRNPIVHEG